MRGVGGPLTLLPRALAPAILFLLADPAGATLFPYALVDAAGVPRDRCASGQPSSGNVWPARAGHCHDAPGVPCVADPPNHVATSGLRESSMCSHIADSTPDGFPVGLCNMATSDPVAACTAQTAAAVCGSGGSCSSGGCAPIGGIARCGMSCLPFAGPDVDCDGTPNSSDACPWYPSTLPEATNPPAPSVLERRRAACLCGDQNANGALTVSDILAVNVAIFSPAAVQPLCDANNDRNCSVSDLISVNVGIFNPGATRCGRHPVAAPQ
jgi:hypothetical protein